MIEFKSVRYKNFLSTGNDFTEIKLNKSPNTLIVGQNGAGKSTLLDALSFALFGKPHRDIKKDQLINSINKKHTVVEVEFNVGNSEFKVHRGIKPVKFEIYQNGNLINQSSNARDYQKFLEQNILKLNHKSFHQVVVLGSSSFIPFMQLPSQSRREVIEDLLDINIFSKMNMLLKERSGKIKEELQDIEYNIKLVKEKVDIQKKYIEEITKMNDSNIKLKMDQIHDINEEIAEIQEMNGVLSAAVEETPDYHTKKEKYLVEKSRYLEYSATFKSKIKDLVREAKFFESNDTCPTCEQDIDHEFKSTKLSLYKEKASELSTASEEVRVKVQDIENDLADIEKEIKVINDKQQAIHSNNKHIALLQNQIESINNEISSLNDNKGDVFVAHNKLDDLVDEKDSLMEKKLRYIEERSYNEAIGEMLKDTGIKTKIIKQYLPAMNKLINQYLQILDFFVSFNLDENFNETIKSRHRDDFNYASFSEGEKQRIDLALLFTWRQIARMKNSANTNLLILDETFDSSLDVDGVDNLTKILDTLNDNSNVFIISHKGDVLENKFRSKIEFYKEGNFSKMK